MRGQRGAAMLETAIALPVMLAALYGVSWGVRVGTVYERAETAVRYAGVIAAQQSPYTDYSFYTLYNNLGSSSQVRPQACQTPSSLTLTGGSYPVVPGTPAKTNAPSAFWQPDTGSVRSSCVGNSPRQTLSGGDLSRSFILLMSDPKLTASVTDVSSFGDQALPHASVSTSTRFFRSPDLATLLHCEDQLSNPVSFSLQPTTDKRTVGATAPLTNSDLQVTTIAASANCAAAAGAQPTLPPQAPYSPLPGSQVPPSHSQPTPSPPTPKPSTTPAPSPSPAVSPSAGASATPPSGGGGGTGGGGGGTGGGGGGGSGGGGGGTGGGGGGTPTTTPTTPKPTTAPKTPAPTITPSTPKPTTTPKPTPVPTPIPTPTSNGTTS